MTYIIQTASAKMPSSVRHPYRRIAVLQVEDGLTAVSMISERAVGVIRIVETWERLSTGKTTKCAYRRAMVEAEALLARLKVEAAL